MSEIAHILDVDRATVRRWLLRFEKDGMRGLIHGSTGKSRKRKFNDTVRDAVARIAMASPAALGEPFTHWSLRRLRVHVMRRGIVRDMSGCMLVYLKGSEDTRIVSESYAHLFP